MISKIFITASFLIIGLSIFIYIRWKFNTVQKYQELYNKVYGEVFEYALTNSNTNLLDEIFEYDEKFTDMILNTEAMKIKNHYKSFCEKYGKYSNTYQKIKRDNKIRIILQD